MQPKVQLTQNGQELQQADINTAFAEASAAEDQAINAFLRMAPYGTTNFAGSTAQNWSPNGYNSPDRMIVPFGNNGDQVSATVSAGTGAVNVYPFRAVIGSRDTYANIGNLNQTDIRTQLLVGASAAIGGEEVRTIALNTTDGTHYRWDLIYASVTIDANAAAVTRYVKSPSTLAVSANSIVTQVNTTVTVVYLPGTANTSATAAVQPTLPADAGGVYNIPLAYVAVQPSFTSGVTALGTRYIYEVAPTPGRYRHLGLNSAQPASSMNDFTGAPMVSYMGTNGAVIRPDFYMPPSMAGVETLLFWNGTGAALTQASQTAVDNTRSWDRRIFRVTMSAPGNDAFLAPAWGSGVTPLTTNPGASTTGGVAGTSNAVTTGAGGAVYQFVGQSFINDAGSGGFAEIGTIGAGAGLVARYQYDSSHWISLYVDYTAGAGKGVLRIAFTAGIDKSYFWWIEATNPYPNY